MRTLDDLQSVFADLAAAAPTELRDRDGVLAPPSRHDRRRIVALVAAAAVVIAIAVGIAASRHDDKPQPAKPSPTSCPRNEHCPQLDKNGKPVTAPTAFTLSTKPGSGWSPYLHMIDTSAEQLQVARTGGSGDVAVTSYSHGAALPHYTRLRPAAVPGHDAYYVDFGSESNGHGVAWQQGGRTVVVMGLSTTSDAVVLSAARALTAATAPITLPFRFRSLPGGLVPEGVSVLGADPFAPGAGGAAVGFTDGKPTQDSDQPAGKSALYVELGSAHTKITMTRLPQQASGHPMYTTVSGDVVVRIGDALELTLSANPARTSVYPTAKLIWIAQQMTFVPDPSDSRTWFTDKLFSD